jgi:prefoldin subunit 5
MAIRGTEAVLILQALKQIHSEIEALRQDVGVLKKELARIEEEGLNINIFERGSDGESESGEESGVDSPQSAPF